LKKLDFKMKAPSPVANFDEVNINTTFSEQKEPLTIDWPTVRKELARTWQPLGDEIDEKTIDTEQQVRNCRGLKSRWVFHQTPPIQTFFKLDKVLGNPGQYGIVREGIAIKGPLQGEKVAIKTVAKWKYSKEKITQSFFEDLRGEVRLMRASENHPNVIKIYKVFEDIQNLHIVMEHCAGGELFEQITSDGVESPDFDEAKASKILRQIISGTYHLHKLGVAHCDLKPENFIFKTKDPGATLKLIDFGMAKIVQWRMYHKRMNGTPYYIAPEVLKGHYNESCDMWSIGVIMFIMIFGFPPFYDNTNNPNRQKGDKIIYANVKKGFFPKVKRGYGPWFPKAQPVSINCKDLIARLLRSDVASRMTSEEAMSHPWILGTTKGGKLFAPLDSDVLRSVKYFNRKCQLQAEILLLLKELKYLSKHQEEAVKKTFEAMDLDGDGMINLDDLYRALHEVDSQITREDCKSIMASVDASNNGVLNYNDLLSIRISRKLISKEERLRKVFRCLDVKGTKRLTPAEVQGALLSVHKNITLEESKRLVREAKKNSDGDIDYEDWLDVFV